MTQTEDRLRVVAAVPLDEELCRLIERIEPRVEMISDPALVPPMRWPADWEGDPAFSRTPQQQADYEAMVDSADALFGIPDVSPAQLARTVAANPRLRWVMTTAAGGGGQVKAAGLDQDALDRIVFTTSAGVHAGPLAEFAVFGVLAGAKGLPRLRADQDARVWPQRWEMRQIDEMTVLVVGLGGIGAECARRFHALGATVWGTRHRTSPDLAAFANGTQVRYLDYNDTYLSLEPAHPSDNIPACVAVAESCGADGQALIAAIAAAYEIQCRLCDAGSIRARGWDHVVYGAVSTSAAAGWLWGLRGEQLAHAISLGTIANIAMRQTRVGELSHFVGDGSQPLHVTTHFNGWGDYPNPNGYSTARLHGPFESDLVQATVKPEAVAAKMTPYKSCNCPIEQRVVARLDVNEREVRIMPLEGEQEGPHEACLDRS